MSDDAEQTPEQMLHTMRNLMAEKKALQHLLGRATDEIEGLAAGHADGDIKDRALKAALRFRRAADL